MKGRASGRLAGRLTGGLTLAWVVAAGVLLGGPVGMALFGLALGLAAVIALALWGPLESVKVERLLPDKAVRVGDPVDISWRVSAIRWWPWFSLSMEDAGLDTAPEAGPGGGRLSLLLRRSGQVGRRLPGVTRGVHRFDTVILTAADPFGLVRRQRRMSIPGELEVWPIAAPAADVQRLLSTTDGAAVRKHLPRDTGALDGQTRGVRVYAPGDPLRLVHWPATAKTGRLLVRQFENRPVVLHVVVEAESEPTYLERALSQAAALVEWGLHHGHSVALTTAADHVPAGSGPAHLRRLMRVLALAQVTDGPDKVDRGSGTVVLRVAGEEPP